MAKQVVQNVVRCSFCGSEIAPTTSSIPTDYVWYEGKIVCQKCLREGVLNPSKQKQNKK